MSDISVRHSRQAPPEWSSLLDQTNDSLTTAAQDTMVDTVIEPLYDQVCEMEDESREETYYFALGGVMCGMARDIQRPEVLDRIVEQASDALVTHHYKMGAGRYDPAASLSLASLQSWGMSAPAARLARKANMEQDPATRILGNVLDRAVHYKRRKQNESDPAEQAFIDFQRRTDHTIILTSTPIADTIGANTFVTSVALIRRALGYDNPEEFESFKAVISNDAEKQALADIDLRKVAARMASIRQDEFTDFDTFYKLLGLEDGQLVFRKENLAKTPPELAENSIILHNKRLRCPAIGAHLLPFATMLTPRIILSAVEKVEARQ